MGIDVENISKFVPHEQPSHGYCNLRTELPDVRSVLQPQVELANPEEGQVRRNRNSRVDGKARSSSSKNSKQQVYCSKG
jgi:hypothetical protein